MGVRKKYQAQVEAERAAEQSKPDTTINVAVVHTKPAQTPEQAEANASAADDASARLKEQIAQLHQSEAIQRQAHAQHQQGLSEEHRIVAREQDFMREHPLLLQHPELTQWAYQQAQRQGHKRGTEDLLYVTKALVQQEAAKLLRATPNPAPAPTPHPEYEEHAMPNYPEPPLRRIVSAPVSREGSYSGGYSGGNRKVTLTPAQREIAKLSGLTEVEYARQVQKLPEYFATRGRENGGGGR